MPHSTNLLDNKLIFCGAFLKPNELTEHAFGNALIHSVASVCQRTVILTDKIHSANILDHIKINEADLTLKNFILCGWGRGQTFTIQLSK